jgi:metal-responsive CopG/Arc/MetJ family transcriptional regulator
MGGWKGGIRPIDQSLKSTYSYTQEIFMAVATINLTFDDDLIKQIDLIANNESLTRTDLIYNSVKMYINRKQKLQELFAYGECVALRNNFTEEDVMEEIKKYRNNR